MDRKPLVSIIIPTYNRAHMVVGAIESALAQTYTNKEIIVVDDGSSDNTAEIVNAFAGVQYVYQEHGRQPVARNNGWKHSNGKYLANLDSDDRWHPDFVERCVAYLEQEDLDFVFANWEQERPQGGSFSFLSSDHLLKPYLHQRKGQLVVLEHHQLRELYIKGCPSPSSSLVMRSASLVQGWNEKMNIGDDWCMLLDLVMAGKCKAAFTLETLWHKHINCNNIYDGRDHIEVNRLLFVEDMHTMMTRFAHLWTKEEYNYLEKNYLKNLVRSAKHSLFTYSNVKESMSLMRRAIATNPLYTTKVFTSLF